MSEVKRPSGMYGALGRLNRELHLLRQRAHEPSMRDLEKDSDHAFSYATAHDIFSKNKLPNGKHLMKIVELLAGRVRGIDVDAELDRFDKLWAAAVAERDRPTRSIPSDEYEDAKTFYARIIQERLDDWMNRADLTTDQLLEKMDQRSSIVTPEISPHAMAEILDGERLPTRDEFRSLVYVLTLTPDERAESEELLTLAEKEHEAAVAGRSFEH